MAKKLYYDRGIEIDVLGYTQAFRVNCESGAQFREYLEHYRNMKGELQRIFTPEARTIIVLTRMGWGKRKIHARTMPHISERQIKNLLKKHRFLGIIKQKSRELAKEKKRLRYRDALDTVSQSLGFDGEALSTELYT